MGEYRVVDPGRGHFTGGAAHHQRADGQFPFLVVQRLKIGLLAGLAHDDLRPGQLLEVECMQRLPHLVHDVVGYIYDVVSRAQANCFQSLYPANRE